jgi:deoxyribodipyrimidine photo-lyase
MIEKQAISLLWYKRDLRVYDHEPLQCAIAAGLPVLFFYAYEPSIMAYPDWDIRHGRFVYQSILDLEKRYPQIKITIFCGELLDILACVGSYFNVQNIYSYEEVGTKATYDRDKQITHYCKQHNIAWHETPVNAIQRGAKNRNGWDKVWNERMYAPIIYPDLVALKCAAFDPPIELSIDPDFRAKLSEINPLMQVGGESVAIATLSDFLSKRYVGYSKGISKPELAQTTCSRLSPYITWGNLSIRQVIQAVEKQRKKGKISEKPMQAFVSRLHWHCHFIQKFESECRIEFENTNIGYDLLDKSYNEQYINAWKTGQTGYPLVDACMRSVVATGYLNFRMRAMLVSFLTHNLWQRWQDGVYHLAKQFLDYEPGIHFPQFQMQAGVTGINTIRIYNPTRNALLHDAEAVFIRKWVPELAHLPTPFVLEPQKMTILEQQFYDFQFGRDYPAPIVDINQAQKIATEKMWNHRDHPAVLAENERILHKHTFRKDRADKAIINFQEANFIDDEDEGE